MRNLRLSRRTVLRGALATGATLTLPLPVLDIMLNGNGDAFAQGGALPKRYVTWFFGNGILPPLWNPVSTGPDWALSSELAPLAAIKNWLTVVTGLTGLPTPHLPHPTGSAIANTGADFANDSAQIKSIDQVVAGVNKGGLFSSIEVGVTNASPKGSQNTLKAVSHRGPSAPNYPEFDPHAVFSRMFGNATPTTGTSGSNSSATADQVKRTTSEKSILDAVLADGAEMNKQLGAKDQARLADHLAAIRQIETRLSAMPVTTTAKTPTDPTKAGVLKDGKSEAPAAVNEVMAEMFAVGLASQIMLNGSFVFTLPAAHVFYRGLGSDMNDDFHDTICHTDPGDNAHQTRVDRGVIYAMQSLAVFLQKLATLSEGSGSVLDNSLVYATSCTSWGKIHAVTEWPVLLAGKAGGALKSNQHLRYPGQNLSNVLLTIANCFGANLKSIGLADTASTGELSGLRISG